MGGNGVGGRLVGWDGRKIIRSVVWLVGLIEQE